MTQPHSNISEPYLDLLSAVREANYRAVRSELGPCVGDDDFNVKGLADNLLGPLVGDDIGQPMTLGPSVGDDGLPSCGNELGPSVGDDAGPG